MADSETWSYSYIKVFGTLYEKENESKDLLREHGVWPKSETCTKCGKKCIDSEKRNSWACWASYKMVKKKIKRRKCWFERGDSNLKAWKIVLLINHFISHHWDHYCVIKELEISSKKSVDWRSFCSEVTEFWFDNQEAIGGENIEIEIDEPLLIHRKYNRGRVTKQIWFFGAIERISK